MRTLKRILIGLLATTAVLLLTLVVGYRVWLSEQSPRLRANLEVMRTSELLGLIAMQFLPPSELADNADYGRELRAGRGHAPWVLRSSLDGRPRMLSLALGPDGWAAWSTEHAALHRVWRGDIHFSGPVHDAVHGGEPRSRGVAWLAPPAASPWRVRRDADGTWEIPRIRWHGHAIDPETGSVRLRYELEAADGEIRRVVERPELHAAGGNPVLERRFRISEAGPQIALLAEAAGAQVAPAGNVRLEDDLLVFDGGRSSLILPLGASTIEIDARQNHFATTPFVQHGCVACHHEREQIVGPAFFDIALRHFGEDREAAAEVLAARIREGSAGLWGETPMPANPQLDHEQALGLAREILAMSVDVKAPAPEAEAEGVWSFDLNLEKRPATLHPALSAERIGPAEFRPQTGGLALREDGRLAVATWDGDGSVFLIENWRDDAPNASVRRIAEGLHEPLGLSAIGDALFVMQKQEVTQLVDASGDGIIDEYRQVTADFGASSNFHEFGFGLPRHGDELIFGVSGCVRPGGDSCLEQHPDRGSLFAVDPETGATRLFARGFRTPNGLAASRDGRLLVTDNQGTWLPASKLVFVEEGSFHGWRAPDDSRDHGSVTPATVWLPQNEVGNSPTQPLELSSGPYAGQILFGDIFNGGLKRVAWDEVEGTTQGAAFHFSGGLSAGINRLIDVGNGQIVAGGVGSRGNWGEPDKNWYGLELLSFSEEAAFEPFSVHATPEGFEILFTRPLAEDTRLGSELADVRQWSYRPNEFYGGPKYDLEELGITHATLDDERRRLSLRVPGREPNRIVHLSLDEELRSARGEPLWTTEIWYTQNTIPRADPTAPTERTDRTATPPNTLSAEEEAAGYRLLWDGRTFDGWKIYGRENDSIDGWVIEDDALKFTRDVSFLGMIWNHIAPWNEGALDLMTKEKFRDFDLKIDWKVSPGANSGILYAIPDEEERLSWTLSLEMQVLDDARHADGQIELHRAGDLYDLQSLARGAARPVGEWNEARIRVRGDHIEHWLNGVKVADIVRGSPEWDAAIAASKFDDLEGYGLAREGHLSLQDHGDIVWYRNLRIRELDDSRLPPDPN